MNTLGELFRTGNEVRTFKESGYLKDTPLLGIEVELEKFAAKEDPSTLRYWNLKEDGSLRNNGMEFVLKVPLKGFDLESALRELEEYLQKCKYDASKRCSTHIHVDVRDFTFEQLRTLVTVFCMFEEFLFRYVGGNRDDNFYCLPLYKSNQNKMDICWDISNQVIDLSPKYSSLNIQPIRSFGSVEFRMQDALTDFDSLVEWSTIISKIANFAKSYKDEISNLFEGHSEQGGEAIFNQVFEEVSQCLLSRVPLEEREQVFKKCMRSAQDILVLIQEHRFDFILRGVKEDPSLWKKKVIDPDNDIKLQDPEDYRSDVEGITKRLMEHSDIVEERPEPEVQGPRQPQEMPRHGGFDLDAIRIGEEERRRIRARHEEIRSRQRDREIPEHNPAIEVNLNNGRN